MKGITNIKGILFVLSILITVLFIFPVHATEKKKFTVNTEVKSNQSRDIVYLEDKPKHQLTQTVSTRTMKSTNPDFNDMEVINYGQADSIAGTGSHNGYSFYYHKSGDKAYTKWTGTHKTKIKEDKSWESYAEGKIKFIGGTGKFKDIKGGGTYTCTHTAKKESCEGLFEAEY